MRARFASGSSTIWLGQSLLPVQITICSVYGGIVPFRGLTWSMSRFGGVGAQAHVGEGHVGMVGKGGDRD